MPGTDVTSAREAPAPSKTRRKQDMHALQELGVALVSLDPARLATLDLPEKLAEAIAFARRTTRHEARRRQLQYIGRLMRDVDAAPIRATLAAWAEGPRRERARFALVEHWRDRLLDEADALQAFVAAYPAAPRETLATLIADARAERQRDGTPRHARMLFRALARIVEAAPPDIAPRAPTDS
jgi:ribosome-associated protein